MEFGTRFKLARVLAGVRQYEIAQAVNIPQSRLSLIESGRLQVDNETKRLLAEAVRQRAHNSDSSLLDEWLTLEGG